VSALHEQLETLQNANRVQSMRLAAEQKQVKVRHLAFAWEDWAGGLDLYHTLDSRTLVSPSLSCMYASSTCVVPPLRPPVVQALQERLGAAEAEKSKLLAARVQARVREARVVQALPTAPAGSPSPHTWWLVTSSPHNWQWSAPTRVCGVSEGVGMGWLVGRSETPATYIPWGPATSQPSSRTNRRPTGP
jgi:hypothetical protein